MNEKKTLLVGEPLAMFIAKEYGELEDVQDWTLAAAGAELNVAIGLKRLEHQVGYMSKLGNDPLGRFLVKRMQQDGIETNLITWSDERPTAIQLKQKVAEGDPGTFNFRSFTAARTMTFDDVKDLDFSAYDWFHCTGVYAGLTDATRDTIHRLSDIAHKQGSIFSFDPNLRPYLWPSEKVMADYMNSMAAASDYFFPGIKECKICIGEDDPVKAAQKYLDSGCKCVIIKLGAQGAYYATASESGYVEGFKVEHIVDTVGAGDGFAAGVISAIKEGLSLPEAVRRGNAIGAIQLTSKGDNDGLPTREELEKFMNGDKNWRITK